jgi:DNA-binding NtrC family response regulator
LDGLVHNAINGIETLDKIRETKPQIPVILLSSQDKIDVAIRCMHHGAFDYVVKSETAFLRLQKVIESIFNLQKVQTELKWYMDRM